MTVNHDTNPETVTSPNPNPTSPPHPHPPTSSSTALVSTKSSLKYRMLKYREYRNCRGKNCCIAFIVTATLILLALGLCVYFLFPRTPGKCKMIIYVFIVNHSYYLVL